MFNINLTQNFNNPYFATSIADFWRRWHISFSSWILDYIFKPLQIRWRYWGSWGIAAALLITFVVSGIWHGASLGYVVWGILHGLYMAIYSMYRPYQKKINKYLGVNSKSIIYKLTCIFIVFNQVAIAWIFFRAETLKDALYIIKKGYYESIISKYAASNIDHVLKVFDTHTEAELVNTVLIVISMLIIYLLSKGVENSLVYKLNTIYRYMIYNILIILIIVSLVYGDRVKAGFIYMDF